MKCKNCGAEILAGANFCTECGCKVESPRLRTERSGFLQSGIFQSGIMRSGDMRADDLRSGDWRYEDRRSRIVQMGISRLFVIVLPLLIIQIILAVVFMHRSKDPFDDPFFANDGFEEEMEDLDEGEEPDEETLADPVHESEEMEESKICTYESKDGWEISYDREKFFLNDTLGDGQICFNYTGECSGTTAVIVSCFPDKMPDEVLYEQTAEIEDSRITRGETYFGEDMYWSHYRHIAPENEDPNAGDVVYEGFIAIEHNGGTVLIDSIEHGETDDDRYSAIINSMSELLNTFELVNHEPQTEYAYMVGEYSRSYEEEFGGDTVEVTESVILNEDHTCEVTFQDTVVGEWGGTSLWLNDGQEFEIDVEGDSLFLYQNEEWIEFIK